MPMVGTRPITLPGIAGTVAHAIATDIDCAYFDFVRSPYGTYDQVVARDAQRVIELTLC